MTIPPTHVRLTGHFRTLRRVKTWLRSTMTTMTEQKLSGLCILRYIDRKLMI